MPFGKELREFKSYHRFGWRISPLNTKIAAKCSATIKKQLKERTSLYDQEIPGIPAIFPREAGF